MKEEAGSQQLLGSGMGKSKLSDVAKRQQVGRWSKEVRDIVCGVKQPATCPSLAIHLQQCQSAICIRSLMFFLLAYDLSNCCSKTSFSCVCVKTGDVCQEYIIRAGRGGGSSEGGDKDDESLEPP